MDMGYAPWTWERSSCGRMDIRDVFLWERTCKKTNIKGLRFNDLRHEATSRLFEKGLSIMEVASITGHKDIRMLRTYTHLQTNNLVKKLDTESIEYI